MSHTVSAMALNVNDATIEVYTNEVITSVEFITRWQGSSRRVVVTREDARTICRHIAKAVGLTVGPDPVDMDKLEADVEATQIAYSNAVANLADADNKYKAATTAFKEAITTFKAAQTEQNKLNQGGLK